MNPIIKINDLIPNILKEYSKRITTVKPNFCQYLVQIILNDSEYNQWKNIQNNPNSYNMEEFLKNALSRRQLGANNTAELLISVDELVPFFIEKCLENFLPIDPCFAHYYLHLLMRDFQEGLVLHMHCQNLSICKIEQFLGRALEKYKNPLDATVSSMKLMYFCKTSEHLCMDFVKEKYEFEFREKLQDLISSILQYPESSNDKQLEEMFIKMQMFIVTNYQIGCPKNHVVS